MSELKIYFADSDELVEGGNPVAALLNRDDSESVEVRLYAMCDAGYRATDSLLHFTGATASKWQVALDLNGEGSTYEAPGDPMNIGDVGNTPKYFWVKISSSEDEPIVDDIDVGVNITGVIHALGEPWADDMLYSYKALNPEQAVWLEMTADGQNAQIELWNRLKAGGYLHTNFYHKDVCDFVFLLKITGNTTGRDIQKTGTALRWDIDGTVYSQNNLPTHALGYGAGIVTVSTSDGWDGVAKWFIEDNPFAGGCPKFTFSNCTELNIRDTGMGYGLPHFDMPLTGFSCRNNNFTGAMPPLHFPNIQSNQYRVDVNNFTSFEVFLANLWANRMAYVNNPTINISGNAEPLPVGGHATDPSPEQPSNGKEYIYSLMNDPFSEGFNKWAIIPDYEEGVIIEGKVELRDYNFAQIFNQEVYDYYHNNVVPDYNHGNYNTVVYVDPTYSGGGNNGSISNPYTSVMNVPISSNMAIRVKRGTTHNISGSSGNWDTPSGAAHIFIGAYGEGPRPIMTGDNIRFRGHYSVVRDLEGKFAYTHTSNHAHNAVMFNIKSGSVWTFSNNLKAIGCEFSYAGRNGMFVQQWDLSVDQHVEIAYCYIHHVNQRWHSENKSESYADGDGIQFSQYRGSYHIHDCIVDRSDTGNKFCIIVNAHTNEGHMLAGLIENNWLIGPHPYPDGGAIIYLGNVVPEPTASAYHYCTIRNNRIIGSPYSGSYTGSGLYTNSTLTFMYGNIFMDLNYAARIGSAFGESEFWNNTYVKARSENHSVQHQCHYMYNNIFPHSSHGSSSANGGNINLSVHSPTDVFHDPANEDYRLKVGSPAIDAGLFQPFMEGKHFTDISGKSVPQNNNIDIGALQY